jgi:hypothetical protein
MAVLAPTQEPTINPAFVKTPTQLTKVWDLGIKESKKQSNLESRLKKTRKTIGTYRTSVLGASEGSSFVYYVPPELIVYFESYNAAREYAPADKVAELKRELIPERNQTIGTIYFYTSITLMPMFAGGYGRVSRHADPNDLKDVKVVLKVGDRILQPEGGHPGNLLQSSGSATNSFVIPRYQYSTTTSSASGSAYGSGGYAYGTAYGKSTTVTTYHEYREEGWSWYHGDFFVGFKIVGEDGKPLINEKDKEMTLLVIYGESEREAKYKLADLVEPYK